jgi:hypothetical protein
VFVAAGRGVGVGVGIGVLGAHADIAASRSRRVRKKVGLCMYQSFGVEVGKIL